MGAQVQCKSYLPGYYPMRGQDDDRNGSWSIFFDGKDRNGNSYSEAMLKAMNRYSEYDKEMLKRTMLEHEAIFRKQVYELHRLYIIQKNLMDELKRKELYRFSLQMDSSCTTQGRSLLSQAPMGDNKKKLHASHLPFENSPLNILNENRSSVQSCRSTVENGGSKDDELSESKSNRFPRRMLDLELPADVYIDDEGAGKTETGFAAAMEPRNDLKLTLGIGEDSSCRENCQRSDSRIKNDLSVCNLADLNEPVKESPDREIGSASAFIFGPRTDHEDAQENKLPLRAQTTAQSLQRDMAMECSLNFLHAHTKERRQDWPFFTKDSGQSHCRLNSLGRGLYNEKAPIVSKAVELKPSRTNESLSQLDPSWRRPTNQVSHVPIAVQALPCFNTSSTMNLQFNHNSSNHTSIISDKPNQNGNHSSSAFGTSEGHRLQKCFKSMHCIDVKSAKDLNLNQAYPNDIVDSFTMKQDTLRKHEESSAGIPWLRKEPSCDEMVGRNASKMNFASTQSCTQLLANCTAKSSGFERKPSNGKALFTSGLQEFRSSLEINEASDCLSSQRLLRFPFVEQIQQSDMCLSSVSHQSHFLSDKIKCNERAGIQFEITSGSSNKISRNQINLNSSTCMENPTTAPKVALEIDLEAPVTCQADDGSTEMEHNLPFSQLSVNKAVCSNESLHEKCIREAAESIFAISQDTCNNANKPTCHEKSVTEFDTLLWFAEVVSSNAEVELKGEGHSSEYLDDGGLDLFESMTLKLEDMKVEEVVCHHQGFDNQDDEGKDSAALLLLTKPRRGPTKKRRQKRDFQKDILPGLATLSRHEVTEDLKTIEGLVRAAGLQWQTSPTRKNSGRKGTQSQGRGRQRSAGVPVAPIVKPVNAEPDADEKGIVGWGRTTRRCRRPRCPPGSIATTLV